MLFFHGFGHFHPETQLDNAFLESLDIGTNDRWIVERVGIKNRRTVLPLDYIRATKNKDLRAGQEAARYSNAQTGAFAAKMAIERAGIKPEDIGMVIAGDCSPDTCIPAEGARIARELGLAVPAFDLHSACSTFGAQVHFLSQMQDAPEYVLVVSPENTTRVTDFSDRSSAILFGDATSAAVVSTKVRSRARLVRSVFGVNPAGCDDVAIPRVKHFAQNGSAVQKFAIKMMSQLLGDIQAKVGPERRERLYYVGHQANLTMLEAVCRRCEIAPDRHLYNIVEYGNQAAAGAPVVMSMEWERFRPGDVVALVVVGSGLSWSS
ncbi:MAG TPA: ketoacyl-ACP synthase III, partial [Minicystis sp.]|nr:ketoacyl-ACP synthase III [Minicystis sp.]